MLGELLKQMFPERSTYVISQDYFVFEESKIPKVRNETDWEHPASIDFERFADAINKAAEEYDIVIAEGLLVFYDPDICALFDRKIFLEIEKELFEQRKSADKRWGDFPDWYVEHIWQSYLKYGVIGHDRKDFLFLEGVGSFDLKSLKEFLGLK